MHVQSDMGHQGTTVFIVALLTHTTAFSRRCPVVCSHCIIIISSQTHCYGALALFLPSLCFFTPPCSGVLWMRKFSVLRNQKLECLEPLEAPSSRSATDLYYRRKIKQRQEMNHQIFPRSPLMRRKSLTRWWWLVFWAQSATRNYIRAENKFHSIS